MQNKLVSIIIPVYNCEKYIEGAIESALNQSYSDIEVIAVNDGSKDNSKELIERLAEKDKRVILVDKKNGGVSSARNAGIEAARGEYITFLDADDEYLPYALETMLTELESDTELLVCSHRKIWIKSHDCQYNNQNITKNDLYESFFDYNKYFHFCWGNIYLADIIKKNCLKFNENVSFSEDYEFNLNYIKHTDKILKVCDKLVYNYYICRSGEHEKRDYPKRDIDVIINFFDGKDNIPSQIYDETVRRYLTRCVERTMSWYGVKKTAEALSFSFNECSEFITPEILEKAFGKEQAERILENDYISFTKRYFNEHKKNIYNKYRYYISRFIVKLINN